METRRSVWSPWKLCVTNLYQQLQNTTGNNYLNHSVLFGLLETNIISNLSVNIYQAFSLIVFRFSHMIIKHAWSHY